MIYSLIILQKNYLNDKYLFLFIMPMDIMNSLFMKKSSILQKNKNICTKHDYAFKHSVWLHVDSCV